ncbi:MAG: hypothetical protein RL497_2426 [Pseudomonadota bacterium]
MGDPTEVFRFSIAPGKETAYVTNVSPADTEWAFGSISSGVQTLNFQPWQLAVGSPQSNLVNRPMVVHLISEDIYLDIKFLSWHTGREGFGGGAFSYERSTPAVSTPTTLAVPTLPQAGYGVFAVLLLGAALRKLPRS